MGPVNPRPGLVVTVSFFTCESPSGLASLLLLPWSKSGRGWKQKLEGLGPPVGNLQELKHTARREVCSNSPPPRQPQRCKPAKIPCRGLETKHERVYDPVDLNSSPCQAIIPVLFGANDQNHNLWRASEQALIMFQDKLRTELPWEGLGREAWCLAEAIKCSWLLLLNKGPQEASRGLKS